MRPKKQVFLGPTQLGAAVTCEILGGTQTALCRNREIMHPFFDTDGSRVLRKLISLALCLSLAGVSWSASADDPDPHPLSVWRHSPSASVQRGRTRDFGLDEFPDATTRNETELQASIDLERLPVAVERMEALRTDSIAAARVFGAGYRVVRLNKLPRDVWDQYLDTEDGLLASIGASLRLRTENGTTQINFKPPGGVRYTNGMAHRVEAGITVPAAQLRGTRPTQRLLRFLRNTRLRDNPLRELAAITGRSVDEFFNPQVDARQERHIYEVQRFEQGSWVKVSEVTLDRVVTRDPSHPDVEEVFGRVEAEGEHVTTVLTPTQRAALMRARGVRPHSARDAANAQHANSEDVQNIHRIADALSGYLEVQSAGESKYAQARSTLARSLAARGRTTALVRRPVGSPAYRVPGVRRSGPRLPRLPVARGAPR